MYWLRRRLLSQNFLSNRESIQKLIRSSSISSQDIVLEIGAGNGVITHELAKTAFKVIAVEIDPRLASRLPKLKNIVSVNKNILDYPLPSTPYKVFSNIPFSITGDIIRKLLQSSNPPSDCYLIVQYEAANKFTIQSHTNTMAALMYYPWWKFSIAHKFNRCDFYPTPRVDSVFLRIHPRQEPLLPTFRQIEYYDFIAYNFVHNPQAKFTSPSRWITFFKRNHIQTVPGSYAKLLEEQSRLNKIHRTRLDRNWRRFK